ncbi:cinnamoyl-CoA reductase CAD2-like [Phragmites australis]|uniref:cinnamoyl-CoA reductase CAD2-like n=1 Tax=Phragmites australis TaxID=29695 RepID=UPI002D799C7B|nr:cinnamoyl-CoA reductase CAD2-like [Phragmites australis]
MAHCQDHLPRPLLVVVEAAAAAPHRPERPCGGAMRPPRRAVHEPSNRAPPPRRPSRRRCRLLGVRNAAMLWGALRHVINSRCPALAFRVLLDRGAARWHAGAGRCPAVPWRWLAPSSICASPAATFTAVESPVDDVAVASASERVVVDESVEPEKNLMVSAVEGTLNVLRVAKDTSRVRRVVVTSSISAIVPSPGWPAGEARDERCWTDIDYCEKNGVRYPASKTLAEKAAWKFAEENRLEVVVVNPRAVLGPIISPAINASMSVLVRLLEGCTEEYADFYMGPVHVEDVASAHILPFENPSASGRHICVESIAHWSDFVAEVAELYPNHKVPKFPKDAQPGLVRTEAASKKLNALGLHFTPVEKIISDAVESLKSRGYIS